MTLDEFLADYEQSAQSDNANLLRLFDFFAKMWVGGAFVNELRTGDTILDGGEIAVPVSFAGFSGFLRGDIGTVGKLEFWNETRREAKTLDLPVSGRGVPDRVDKSTFAQFLISVRDWA